MNGAVRGALEALLRLFDDRDPSDHGWIRLPSRLDRNTVKSLTLLAEHGVVVELPDVPDDLPLTRDEADRAIGWMGDELTEAEAQHIRDLEVARVRSGGEADFLRCIRSALSLTGHHGFPLVVIVLDATALDATHLRIVRLAVQRVVEELVGSDTTDRTLVLESSRALGPDHVTMGPAGSSRSPSRRLTGYATEQGLRVIGTHDFIQSEMVDLSTAWHDRPLCFFLGAGFSLSSRGMPLGDDMRDHALRTMFPMAPDDSPRQHAERLYRMLHERSLLLPVETQPTPDERDRRAHFLDQLTLERVMHAHLQMRGTLIDATLDWFDERHGRALNSPGRAVEEMRRLVTHAREHDRCLIVFTVNFDELLDPAFRSGDHRILATSREIQDELLAVVQRSIHEDGGVIYVKLHGTISDRESLVIDMQATARNPTMLAFQQSMQGVAEAGGRVVYVGHSMRDLDVRPALTSGTLAHLDERWVSLNGPSAPLLDHVFPTRRWWMERRAEERLHYTTADDWMGHFMHVLSTVL